ncbi:MAG TPA: undecaprenyldiphospho-muramoylpentapeptide beta-N-acetylglucosaminyltransferase [Thermoanaerobacterales bacterium]|nr:undecaprenyldiphospho-muramoylpentapeptide beta-N-acetylglucosaminyltransferase [Thermoanaerobacterales bacterium]
MKVVLAGGGTGGHIYPAIAIAKYVKEKNPNADILFIGTKKGLEVELVPKAGFNLETIVIRGLARDKILQQLIPTFIELVTGTIEARRLLKQFSPDIVIGTGGYVCGPVVLSAAMLGIPNLIHEQNAMPGVTNRILSKVTNKVAVSFEESIKFFTNKKKIVVTGNPLRSEILTVTKAEAAKALKIDPQKKLILAFGGSRGAAVINKSMIEVIKWNIKKRTGIQILLITGNNHYEIVLDELLKSGIDIQKHGNIIIEPYMYNMHYALAAADLIISRAGALTISEITAIGKPSILIPLKIAANAHQRFNALTLKKYGAAEIILEDDLNGEVLNEKINLLLNDEILLNKMAENSIKLGKTDALDKIYKIIQFLIN